VPNRCWNRRDATSTTRVAHAMIRNVADDPATSTTWATSTSGSQRARSKTRSTARSARVTSRTPGSVDNATHSAMAPAPSAAYTRVVVLTGRGSGGGSPDGRRRVTLGAGNPGSGGGCPPGVTRRVSIEWPVSDTTAVRWSSVAAAAALLTVACGDGADRSPQRPGDDRVVVASFDFAESRLIAEIYAQALEYHGVDVRRESVLGPRELVIPALRQGFVDVVPDYAGSALDAADPGSPADRSDSEAVTAALADVVRPWSIDVLSPAPASNQNELAVTSAFARARGVHAISDLAPEAPSLTIGGPPECPARPRCLLGLTETYGLRFRSFVPLAGQDLVRRALDDRVIDIGVLFTTDAVLAGDDLDVLDDDRGLQPAENLVPLVRRGTLDDHARAALDDVSAHLTTTNLRFLNWRVANAGTSTVAEARGWLIRQGLISRSPTGQRSPQAAAAAASRRAMVPSTSDGSATNARSSAHSPASVVPPNSTGCRSDRSKRNRSPASSTDRAIRRVVGSG
jgi:osmoprotectant transport system substrate-binding protein